MNKINFIFRILSAILTIFVVVPLYFVLMVAECIFTIANNFTYVGFNGDADTLTMQVMERGGMPMQYYGFIKCYVLILAPIILMFAGFYKGVTSIKL